MLLVIYCFKTSFCKGGKKREGRIKKLKNASKLTISHRASFHFCISAFSSKTKHYTTFLSSSIQAGPEASRDTALMSWCSCREQNDSLSPSLYGTEIIKGGDYYGNDHIAAACLCRLMTHEPNPRVFTSAKLCLPPKNCNPKNLPEKLGERCFFSGFENISVAYRNKPHSSYTWGMLFLTSQNCFSWMWKGKLPWVPWKWPLHSLGLNNTHWSIRIFRVKMTGKKMGSCLFLFPVMSSQADRKDKVHSSLHLTGAGKEIHTQEKRRHGISRDFLA